VAENSGWDSLWTEDHLFYGGDEDGYGTNVIGPWEAWSILGGLAAATERVRIGSLVTPLQLRHPGLLAKQAATVDEMSDGRLVLGIGIGWHDAEFRAVGAHVTDRAGAFADALTILLEAFDTGTSDFRGQYRAAEHFHLAPRGPRQRPELMVGSRGRRTLRTALPHVDGWNWDGFSADPHRFAEQSKLVDEICAEVGRDPSEVWRSAHVVARLEGWEGLPIDPIPDHIRLITGSEQQIGETLHTMADAGADELMIIVDPAKPTALEQLARAREQIPVERMTG
jgi:alkanesulfonate monooxygenase SsuD/methylene tetrahydromethanopterin reductase-like flavin-dependent oxidoreductase (luciferase family)